MKANQSTLTQRCAAWLTAHAYLAFSTGLVLATLLGLGLGKLQLRTDYQVFFAPGAPEVERFHQFQDQFGDEDSLYFAVSAEKGETIFTPQYLTVISDFARELKRLPNVRRVASIANFPLVDAADDNINIAPAFDVYQGQFSTDLNMAQMQQRLLSETSVKHKLISEDGRTAGIFVSFALPKDQRDKAAMTSWQAAQALLQQARAEHNGLEFRVTGSIALDAAFAEANESDLSMLFPAALTIIILLAAMIFRSFVLYLALSLVVIAATLACLGFAGWSGIPLSSVSLTSPVIVVIIGVAEMIHLFVAWRNQTTEDKQQRVNTAIVKILTPALLTTVTTVAGLLMLNTSATPPFRDLGNIAGFGVMMAFVFTFLLGAPLMLLAKARPGKTRYLQNAMESLAAVIVHPKVQLASFALGGVMMITAGCIVLNEVDDNYVHYFGESFEFRRDSDVIDKQLSGIYSLEYSLASHSGSVYSVDYLHAVNEFSRWALQQPGVRSVDSLDDVIAQVHRAFNNGDDNYRVVPKDNDLITQYSMLYEMSVPRDFDFRNRVSASQQSSRVTLYLSNLSISEIAALESRAKAWLDRQPYFAGAKGAGVSVSRVKEAVANDANPDTHRATGTSIIFSHIGLNNIYSMIDGTLLLFAMASVLMWAIFRRASIATMTTLANIIPALVTLGIWGLLYGRIGMGSAAIVTVTLGLVIDDTIHFGHRYMTLRRLGQSAAEAIRGTLVQVGPAILVTSIILTLGFMVIALSAFEINASLGAMVAMTVMMALIFDLFVLPAALLKFDRLSQPAKRRFENVTQPA